MKTSSCDAVYTLAIALTNEEDGRLTTFEIFSGPLGMSAPDLKRV
jgi:hypothetical protein